MKAIAVMAHPDDCALFGYYLIKDLGKHLDWHICYLTHGDYDERYQEMKTFWESRGVSVSTLGFEYEWDDVVANKLTFNETEATTKVLEKVNDYDLIFTHNHLGDYGHVHHLFLNNVLKTTDKPKVYTGIFPDECNINHMYDTSPYIGDDLPLHKSVVDDWDVKSYKYFITPEAEKFFPEYFI